MEHVRAGAVALAGLALACTAELGVVRPEGEPAGEPAADAPVAGAPFQTDGDPDAPAAAAANLEACGNDLDDDGDGAIDEDCGCEPGAERACYVGRPEVRGIGACVEGRQTCDASTEFPQWGDCVGAVLPATELASDCDAVDNDCDGETDEDAWRPCASGCADGREVCSDGAWLPCDAPVPVAASVDLSPWEMNEGEGVVLFDACAASNGAPEEYAYSSVPAPDDPGWGPAPSGSSIDLARGSTLCGAASCRCGGDFTYFRTFITVPADVTVTSLRVSGNWYVDDGFQTTVFSATHPGGVTPADGELAPFLDSGSTSTAVVTHVDDCCSESHISVSTAAAAEACRAP